MRHVDKICGSGKAQAYSTWATQSACVIAKQHAVLRSWSLLKARTSVWPQPQRFVRGAKRKSTIDLDSLPQGILTQDATPPGLGNEVDDEVVYPTVIQQVRNNIRKFDDCVILTRVGGFYEVCCPCLPDQKSRLRRKQALSRASRKVCTAA